MAALTTLMVVTSCTAADEGGVGSPEAPPPSGLQVGERRPARDTFLVRAASCGDFLSTVRARALHDVGPFGFDRYERGDDFATTTREASASASASAAASGAPAAADGAGRSSTTPQAGVDYSTTNVQEVGVDEPDTVKTDGRMLLTTTDGSLRVLDVTGDTPKLLSTLDLDGRAGPLLLVGKRALVFGGESYSHIRGPVPDVGVREEGSTSSVTIVDLADPERPSVVRKLPLDGAYVDARLVGGVARVVLRSSPDLSFAYPTSSYDVDEIEATNRRIVRSAPADAWLPDGTACGDAYLTSKPAGYDTVTVRSVDPSSAEVGPGVSVTASAQQIYASASRLFVATSEFGDHGQASIERTSIHAFDITNPVKAAYAGSGDVPGSLLNQFSMSEHDDLLRVATTLEGRSSESRVTVLRPAEKEWVETGAVEGLGRTERIYAVRFIGPVGYVVTFRQVDPLYVLDLRDPRKPAVTGELKITGYSAYLHPAGNGRLLGLGQEATEQGRRVGTQLSLFDVSDPARPTKLSGVVLPRGHSEAEQDHHAFLHWPATDLVVVPLMAYDEEPFVGAVAFTATDATVREKGRIVHERADTVQTNRRMGYPMAAAIERSLVVGERLLTISASGVQANDLGTLRPLGSAAF